MTAAPAGLAKQLANRYTIERELGAGGMATVYLARDIRHDRKVALKVLKPELAAVIGAARFLNEIKTTANLSHPHILALHDSGEVDGTVFYVMPFVDGESLRDRLNREKQLPVDDALRIAVEVAGALEHAHQRGVIHRDIKPENILLQDGHALVADFGIALAVARTDSPSRMTETGMSLGTPHYMSPEQAMGEREITARADIFALGCVLYEMLIGEPPFDGPTAQAIVARIMTEEPRSITAQRRTVPPHVEAAVNKALSKLPADRFIIAAPEFTERQPQASHDGHWIAYTSDRTGKSEIYVQPYPGDGAAVKVSTDGGESPRWSPDGRTLYYVSTDSIIAAIRAPGNTFEVASRKTVVAGGVTDINADNVNWDISPDGKEFVYINLSAGASARVTWIQGWTGLLRSSGVARQ